MKFSDRCAKAQVSLELDKQARESSTQPTLQVYFGGMEIFSIWYWSCVADKTYFIESSMMVGNASLKLDSSTFALLALGQAHVVSLKPCLSFHKTLLSVVW